MSNFEKRAVAATFRKFGKAVEVTSGGATRHCLAILRKPDEQNFIGSVNSLTPTGTMEFMADDAAFVSEGDTVTILQTGQRFLVQGEGTAVDDLRLSFSFETPPVS